jgi:hypothetical protein
MESITEMYARDARLDAMHNIKDMMHSVRNRIVMAQYLGKHTECERLWSTLDDLQAKLTTVRNQSI